MHEKKQSKFENDLSESHIIHDFLSETFYRILELNGCRIDSKKDMSSQLAGIDVEVTLTDGRIIRIDEKATHQDCLVNYPLNAFCIEEQYMKNGSSRTGWGSATNQTDYYLFCWLKRAGVLKCESIISADCMLVRKDRINHILANKDIYNARGCYDRRSKNVAEQSQLYIVLRHILFEEASIRYTYRKMHQGFAFYTYDDHEHHAFESGYTHDFAVKVFTRRKDPEPLWFDRPKDQRNQHGLDMLDVYIRYLKYCRDSFSLIVDPEDPAFDAVKSMFRRVQAGNTSMLGCEAIYAANLYNTIQKSIIA